MNRDTARPFVLALLCILAIGAAAATLDSAVEQPRSGGGFGGGSDGVGISDQESDDEGFLSESEEFSAPFSPAPICIRWLTSPAFLLGALAAVTLLSAALYRRMGVLGPVAFVGAFGIPAFLLYALLTNCGPPPEAEGDPGGLFELPQGDSLPSGGVGGLGDGGAVSNASPSLALTLVLGVALLVGLALLVRSTGGDDVEEQSVEPPEERPDVSAVARAAGAAADRIEGDADATNEVYRAWREMTGHLNVDRPATSTPAEFAAAAVEAGMARDDVGELTRLFEEVRYGGERPTGQREERALAALRRIEAAYGEDG